MNTNENSQGRNWFNFRETKKEEQKTIPAPVPSSYSPPPPVPPVPVPSTPRVSSARAKFLNVWSKEEDEKILKCINAGYSQKQTSDYLSGTINRTDGAIRQRFQRLRPKIPSSRSGRHWSKAELRKLKECHRDGLSYEQMSEVLGRSVEALKKKSLDIEVKSMRNYSPRQKNLLPMDLETQSMPSLEPTQTKGSAQVTIKTSIGTFTGNVPEAMALRWLGEVHLSS